MYSLITKLRMKNWKSHLDSELEFSMGTNGLVGIVGSGKTSILDAISFGLFGTFPKLQLRKVKLEDLIMKKPRNMDSAEVEVFFTMDGNSYCVKRKIEKNKGTSYSEITENGNVLDSSGTKNVTAIVEKKLKVNYELFSKAIYSEQNSVDYFLQLGKGQRMNKIDELLMIDRFERSRANSVKLTNKLAERKLAKQGALDQLNIEGIERSLEELKQSISGLKDEKAKLRNEFETISKRKMEVEDEVNDLRKIKETFEHLKRAESGLDSMIKTMLETIGNIEKKLAEIGEIDMSRMDVELDKYSKIIGDATTVLREKESERQRIQDEFTKSKANIEFLKQEKIDKLKEEIDEKMKIKKEFEQLRNRMGENVNSQIDEKVIRLQKLIGELEASRSKIFDLQEQMEKISAVKGSCPICGTSLSEERKKIILEEKEEELNKLKATIEKVGAYRVMTEKEIKSLEDAAKKLDKMFREISDLENLRDDFDKSNTLMLEYTKTNSEMQTQLDKAISEIERMREKLEISVSEKQKLEVMLTQMKDYEDKKKKVEELKTEREMLKSNIADLEKRLVDGKLDEMEKFLRNFISKEKEIEMKLTGSDEMIKERYRRVEEYEKSLEVAKKEKAEIERLDKLIQELKLFTEALRQTQQELRKEFVSAVNFTMNKLWETLYPYQDFVSVRLAIEGGDYVLQLQERTMNWVNVEGTASGGERSIACLALRIAFALVLAPQLRWLVLDEPTHNLDTKSVEDLAQTLRERIADIVDQVFIITHEENLEAAITGNLYRLERDKGKDEATKIIQVN